MDEIQHQMPDQQRDHEPESQKPPRRKPGPPKGCPSPNPNGRRGKDLISDPAETLLMAMEAVVSQPRRVDQTYLQRNMRRWLERAPKSFMAYLKRWQRKAERERRIGGCALAPGHGSPACASGDALAAELPCASPDAPWGFLAGASGCAPGNEPSGAPGCAAEPEKVDQGADRPAADAIPNPQPGFPLD